MGEYHNMGFSILHVSNFLRHASSAADNFFSSATEWSFLWSNAEARLDIRNYCLDYLHQCAVWEEIYLRNCGYDVPVDSTFLHPAMIDQVRDVTTHYLQAHQKAINAGSVGSNRQFLSDYHKQRSTRTQSAVHAYPNLLLKPADLLNQTQPRPTPSPRTPMSIQSLVGSPPKQHPAYSHMLPGHRQAPPARPPPSPIPLNLNIPPSGASPGDRIIDQRQPPAHGSDDDSDDEIVINDGPSPSRLQVARREAQGEEQKGQWRVESLDPDDKFHFDEEFFTFCGRVLTQDEIEECRDIKKVEDYYKNYDETNKQLGIYLPRKYACNHPDNAKNCYCRARCPQCNMLMQWSIVTGISKPYSNGFREDPGGAKFSCPRVKFDEKVSEDEFKPWIGSFNPPECFKICKGGKNPYITATKHVRDTLQLIGNKAVNKSWPDEKRKATIRMFLGLKVTKQTVKATIRSRTWKAHHGHKGVYSDRNGPGSSSSTTDQRRPRFSFSADLGEVIQQHQQGIYRPPRDQQTSGDARDDIDRNRHSSQSNISYRSRRS